MKPRRVLAIALLGVGVLVMILVPREKTTPSSTLVTSSERPASIASAILWDDSSALEFPMAGGPLNPAVPRIQSDSTPQRTPKATLERVESANTLIVNFQSEQLAVRLTSVLPPSDCFDGGAAFEDEAERFLARLLEGEELLLEKQRPDASGRDTYVVVRARDRRDINLTLLRNGYGCLDKGNLPIYCPFTPVTQEAGARNHERGMWRPGPPLAEGYISESQNAVAVLQQRRR